MKKFEELGIKIPKGVSGQIKVLCPKCSAKRKKSTEECLSVNLDSGLYKCHNCGWAGGIKTNLSVKETYAKKNYVKPNYNPEDWELTDEAIEYFALRGISKETLLNNYVGSSFTKFSQKDAEEVTVIAFPFFKNEEVVNVKYRTLDKRFKLSKNSEKCFYGIQNLFENGYLATNKLFITEGEIDALSLYEVGFKFALSVPNGAGVEEEGREKIIPKLEYLDDPDIISVFENIDEVIFVTDADYKGRRLREELANRIGIDKCFSVEYPSDCKDANDVLVNYGADALISCILEAKPLLQGLIEVSEVEQKLIQFYKKGLSEGYKTGIEPFDEIYTLQEGLITLVTGTPESYKSVSLDNITEGYARMNDMHIAMFSPETKPVEFHIGRLASIHADRSLNTDSDKYFDYDEYMDACKWVGQHYTFLQPKVPTIEEILTLAKVSILKNGTKILVIDPYSRVRSTDIAETYFIQSLLNQIAEFAVKYKIHVFLVAHPTKVPVNKSGNYPVVTPYLISGSAHWYNSADFIISLWRDRVNKNHPLRIYCLKSKYHHIAKSGEYCELIYDFDSWKFF
jgi:twinkle protein